jgi:hypothetical protein
MLSQWCAAFLRGGEQTYTMEENGACMHVSTVTLKSVCEQGGLCVKKWVIESYLERDAKSRLYKRGA